MGAVNVVKTHDTLELKVIMKPVTMCRGCALIQLYFLSIGGVPCLPSLWKALKETLMGQGSGSVGRAHA